MVFLPYRLLSIVLYPALSNLAVKLISVPSFRVREFYIADVARLCRCKRSDIKKSLEYLRQAGFIETFYSYKEPGRYGKLWARVIVNLPDK